VALPAWSQVRAADYGPRTVLAYHQRQFGV
jgi:hypothetical protein